MREGRASGTVTVLFTDLVGSTELMSQLGDRAFDELRRVHFAALSQAVVAHEGEEVKNTGDGIMVVFPSAAEAVEAAVAMQQATARQARTTPIAIRVGLAVGDATLEGGDVFGTPVVEAARLVAAAQPGQILATTVVRTLARSRCAAPFIDFGAFDLKGLPEPVAVCEVGWQPTGPSVPMPALLTDVGRVFVGRDGEVERLGQLWKEAAAGERRVALLAGEPGVGKTRLAAELALRVHDEGGVVLAGRCDEDLGVPYQPFVEALRHFLDHTPPERLRERLGRYGGEVARLVPELADAVSDLPPPLKSDPETERYRLFDAVASWLSAASAEEPVLFVLDDLQWAAKPTLLLLRHVVRSPDAKRLLLLGTYRDTELAHEHPLVEVLADLRRQGGVERFSLMGLDASGVAAFMEQGAGHALDDEDLVLARAIHQETEGNPFFVREVLRHLAETGAVERRDGRWSTRLSVEDLGIPEGVREVVGRRLSRLSSETNRALRVAAVIGPEFQLPVLRAAGDFEEEPLLSALEESLEARLVIEAPGAAPRYRFAHAFVRDTLYGELSAARRVALHRGVAEAIEAVHSAALDDHLPALAHHWARVPASANEASRSVDYAMRAGDRALAQLAHDEAAAYYRQALELLDAGEALADPRKRCLLLIALGSAQRRTGDPTHRATLLEAARLAQSRGDAEALARAALANSRQGFMTSVARVDHERVAVLEAALEALGGGGAIQARLLATLALELTFTGDRERCRRLSDEALAQARRLGDAPALAHVLAARPYTIAAPATVAERRANADELEATAGRLGDPVMHAWARFHRYRADMELGALDEAHADIEALEGLAGDVGEPTLRWCAAWVRAAYLAAVGRLDDAERHGRLAAEIGEASGQPDTLLFRAIQQFGVRFEQGRLAEVRELFVGALDLNPDFLGMRALAGLVDAELGRLDEAEACFEDLAASRFTDIPVDNIWSVTTTILVLLAARFGDRPRSRVLHDLLVPYSDLIAGTPALWLGSVSHYLGLLATTLGRYDDAEARLAAAEVTHQRIGAPTWLARTRLEWARMLLSRRQPGDTERARDLLDQALATARELGLTNVERQAVALLEDRA